MEQKLQEICQSFHAGREIKTSELHSLLQQSEHLFHDLRKKLFDQVGSPMPCVCHDDDIDVLLSDPGAFDAQMSTLHKKLPFVDFACSEKDDMYHIKLICQKASEVKQVLAFLQTFGSIMKWHYPSTDVVLQMYTQLDDPPWRHWVHVSVHLPLLTRAHDDVQRLHKILNRSNNTSFCMVCGFQQENIRRSDLTHWKTCLDTIDVYTHKDQYVRYKQITCHHGVVRSLLPCIANHTPISCPGLLSIYGFLVHSNELGFMLKWFNDLFTLGSLDSFKLWHKFEWWDIAIRICDVCVELHEHDLYPIPLKRNDILMRYDYQSQLEPWVQHPDVMFLHKTPKCHDVLRFGLLLLYIFSEHHWVVRKCQLDKDVFDGGVDADKTKHDRPNLTLSGLRKAFRCIAKDKADLLAYLVLDCLQNSKRITFKHVAQRLCL